MRQTLRDWVIRFNEQGPEGLINKSSPGRAGQADGRTLFHGVGVLLVGLGPGADMGEAQVLQVTVDGVVADREAKFESAITAFFEDHNANPKPFRWTKSADDILARSSVSACTMVALELSRNAPNFWFRTLDRPARYETAVALQGFSQEPRLGETRR